jgi:hypothetical protein
MLGVVSVMDSGSEGIHRVPSSVKGHLSFNGAEFCTWCKVLPHHSGEYCIANAPFFFLFPKALQLELPLR